MTEIKIIIAASLAGKPVPKATHDQARAGWPYGVWTCGDGRQVMFNRSYQPVWQRASADAPATPADASEWVENIVGEKFFYNDWTSPRRNEKTVAKVLKIMRSWGVA